MEHKFEIIPNEQTPRVLQPIMSENTIKENKELFTAFLEFAKTQENAVGLAANQCSLNGERFNQRIFAVKDQNKAIWQLIIDPVILEYIGMKECKLEGCLTWKDKNIVVYRFRAINVGYYNENVELIKDEMWTGFEAQIFQHEYDHIEGIPEHVVDVGYKLPSQKPTGRNDKCPCGSGKKYKHCCLEYLRSNYILTT